VEGLFPVSAVNADSIASPLILSACAQKLIQEAPRMRKDTGKTSY
jgi:hypothetical protein